MYIGTPLTPLSKKGGISIDGIKLRKPKNIIITISRKGFFTNLAMYLIITFARAHAKRTRTRV